MLNRGPFDRGSDGCCCGRLVCIDWEKKLIDLCRLSIGSLFLQTRMREKFDQWSYFKAKRQERDPRKVARSSFIRPASRPVHFSTTTSCLLSLRLMIKLLMRSVIDLERERMLTTISFYLISSDLRQLRDLIHKERYVPPKGKRETRRDHVFSETWTTITPPFIYSKSTEVYRNNDPGQKLRSVDGWKRWKTLRRSEHYGA